MILSGDELKERVTAQFANENPADEVAVAEETMRANGSNPRAFASAALISTSAAAPSFRPEALAAVTEPSLVKAGRRPDTLSRVAP